MHNEIQLNPPEFTAGTLVEMAEHVATKMTKMPSFSPVFELNRYVSVYLDQLISK